MKFDQTRNGDGLVIPSQRPYKHLTTQLVAPPEFHQFMITKIGFFIYMLLFYNNVVYSTFLVCDVVEEFLMSMSLGTSDSLPPDLDMCCLFTLL